MHAQVASQLIPFRFENAFIDDSVFSSILLFALGCLHISVTLLLPVMWAGKTKQRRRAAEMIE